MSHLKTPARLSTDTEPYLKKLNASKCHVEMEEPASSSKYIVSNITDHLHLFMLFFQPRQKLEIQIEKLLLSKLVSLASLVNPAAD